MNMHIHIDLLFGFVHLLVRSVCSRELAAASLSRTGLCFAYAMQGRFFSNFSPLPICVGLSYKLRSPRGPVVRGQRGGVSTLFNRSSRPAGGKEESLKGLLELFMKLGMDINGSTAAK